MFVFVLESFAPTTLRGSLDVWYKRDWKFAVSEDEFSLSCLQGGRLKIACVLL